MSEQVDLVVLLPGNYVRVPVAPDGVAAMDNDMQLMIKQAVEQKGLVTFTAQDGLVTRLHPTAILGWYFAKRVQSNSDKMLKVMERLEKKLPDEGGSEDWKNQE